MTDPAATPSRIAAATALWQLGHAIVGHEVGDALMTRIAGVAEELAAEVADGPARRRPVEDMKRDLFAGPPDDLESESGRKLLIEGRAALDGVCFAEAEGLFIAIPIERFALDASRPT